MIYLLCIEAGGGIIMDNEKLTKKSLNKVRKNRKNMIKSRSIYSKASNLKNVGQLSLLLTGISALIAIPLADITYETYKKVINQEENQHKLVEVLNEQESKVYQQYLQNEIDYEQYINKIEHINSNKSKLQIIKRHSNKQVKEELDDAYKISKGAKGLAVCGGIAGCIGITSVLASKIEYKKKEKEMSKKMCEKKLDEEDFAFQ